jgi:hypothetical protein
MGCATSTPHKAGSESLAMPHPKEDMSFRRTLPASSNPVKHRNLIEAESDLSQN